MAARLISVCAPTRPRSRNRGCPKIRYLSEAKGCSTVERRSRIISGVAGLLQTLERTFVQMARDQTLPTIRALQLQRTGAADLGLGCIVDSTIFAGQRLTGGTAEGVCLLVIIKLAAVEQRTVSLIVDAAGHRHVRHDAFRFTSLRPARHCSNPRRRPRAAIPEPPNACFAASAIGSRRLF